MGFTFDEPSALFCPDDIEDLEIYSRLHSGISYRGESLEDVTAVPFHTHEAPPVSSWTRLDDTTVSITVDRAREESAEQAQKEIDFIKERSAEVMGTGDQKPELLDITEHLFGRRSRLYRCFVDEIKTFDGQHKMFQRCMGSFFLSCVLDMSVEEMIEEKLYPEHLANAKEYGLFWSLLYKADDNVGTNNRVGEPMWRNIETAINRVVRGLFVDGMEGKMKVSIDDDKVHYAVSRAMKPHEPKAVQHVRDNRRGFVIDTAVYTLSGAPVGFNVQGHGDSTPSSTRQLLQGQFAAATGRGTNSGTLTNVGLDFDRGYTSFSLAADVVALGGSIDSSTCARNDSWPVMYEQKLKDSDDRFLMKKSGPKSLVQFTYRAPLPLNTNFNFFAYRNGNSGITLCLSTRHSGRQWEMVLSNPADRIWYAMVP